MPVLISGGSVDARLGAYFNGGFRRDQTATAVTYAYELATWLSFLSNIGTHWDEATRHDIRAFQVWRLYDGDNPDLVTPATWNKGWAALRHFYRWAILEGWVDRSPVGDQDRMKDPLVVGGYREKNGRSSRDRWITPSEYTLWRDVGLKGYRAARAEEGFIEATVPDENFRGRNWARNTAFCDYVLATGLRSSEAGSLLDVEIPANVGDKAPIVGKGSVLRHYEVLHLSGLDSVASYREGERATAIRRAQRAGLYRTLPNLLVADEISPGGRVGQRVRLASGRWINVVTMSAESRKRLFVNGENGVEPASLWLTESGRPLPHVTWNAIFDTANARVSASRASLGVRSPWVHVTPHSLRFTFALMLLVAGVRASDNDRLREPHDPFWARNYSHVFDGVRDLLGHTSTQTTINIYLEPLKVIRRSDLFNGKTVADVWEQISTSSAAVGFNEGR
ncbi:site-specific integrase [Nesterenkonia sp. YGD6]|uniref:site-specific integrase n=1 Tax=Nesterenkonia sp. YGD6 TaxID=2901231 RepID=UPI00406C306C